MQQRRATHLDNSRQSQDQTTSRPNQEHRRDIERERDRTVDEEGPEPGLGEVVERRKPLGEDEAETDHGGADGGVKVDGDEGVHLHPLQEDLDEDESGGFDLESGRCGLAL